MLSFVKLNHAIIACIKKEIDGAIKFKAKL